MSELLLMCIIGGHRAAIPAIRVQSVIEIEEIAPIRLLSARIREGSGGSGKYPGGNDIRREYLALTDGVSVSLRGERFAR